MIRIYQGMIKREVGGEEDISGKDKVRVRGDEIDISEEDRRGT